MIQRFEVGGILYDKDDFGVLKQVDPKPYVYDAKYSSTYDTESYRKGSEVLQGMRYGFMNGAHGENLVTSVLDCGYGNGAFMLFCRQHIKDVRGYDVTGVDVHNCQKVDSLNGKVDTITFWDCLEHFNDISFLSELECKTICVSLPYCHFNNICRTSSFEQAIIWFTQWKHRKPDEHIRHFNRQSLAKTMFYFGWKEVAYSHHEDIIRRPADLGPNILTMAFKKP